MSLAAGGLKVLAHLDACLVVGALSGTELRPARPRPR